MRESTFGSSLIRRSNVMLLAASFTASLILIAGPVSRVSASVLRQTFTGASGFPELGGTGEVLSIDASTTSAPGGTNSYTTLEDLVVEESRANEIAWLSEDGAPFNGSTLRVEAPAPFAWQAGSGTVPVKRADDPTIDCGSLRGDLTVTTGVITRAFQRADWTNRCVVTVSRIKVIPTAATPLVSEGLLINSGGAPGLPGLVGVLALTTSQGSSPTIILSSSPTVTTCCDPTTFSAAFAANGANRQIRFEQSLDGTTWTAGGTFQTDSHGVARLPLRPRFNRFYRVAFVGGSGFVAGVSNVARVAVRFGAAQSPVHSTVTTIRRGTAVTFTTTVKPVVSHFPVPTVEFRLYHRTSAGWKLASTRLVPTDSLGRASWKVTFGVRGEWYVRSRALATTSNASSLLTTIARCSVR